MKEKNKTNPFGSILNPTEEIIWLSGHRQSWLDTYFAGTSRWFLGFVAALIILMVVVIFTTSKTTSFFETAGAALFFVGLIVLRLFGGRIIAALFSGNIIPRMPETTLYAVTNERLLMRQGDRFSGLPLENVPLMSVLPNGTRGTLSFGAVFPMWSVENVQQVKSIIDQAKKERLKEVNA